MNMLMLVLLLAGFILFILSALGVNGGRVNLMAAGLACWILVALIGAWPS